MQVLRVCAFCDVFFGWCHVFCVLFFFSFYLTISYAKEKVTQQLLDSPTGHHSTSSNWLQLRLITEIVVVVVVVIMVVVVVLLV